jgi:23S rRNA A2030 N6-methylase RlmJ
MRGVANPHFGNLGDVWKHIVLAETLARERPPHYWETHAGSASYLLSHSPARDYGIHYLLEGDRSSALFHSTYYEELTRFRSEQDAPLYPGSALLAMRLLGSSASYLLCDVDEASVRSLSDAVGVLGLQERVKLVLRDGLTAVRDTSKSYKGKPADVLVHIDPFDPHTESDPGLSALSLAADLSARGFKLIYWYGYEFPEQRAWPWATLTTPGRQQWCGDLMVRANLNERAPVSMSDISPIIGCGVIATNLTHSTISALESLGRELVSFYENAVLPHAGAPGALDFRHIAEAVVE